MNWFDESKRDELLRRHIEGDLSSEESAELGRMRSEDPRFDREARRLIAQDSVLRNAPEVTTPPDLTASIMKEVHESQPPSRLYAFLFRPRTLTYRLATGMTAAAAVAAAIILAIWSIDDTQTGPDPIVHANQPGAIQEAATDEMALPPSSHNLVIEMAVGTANTVRLVGDFNGWREEGLELSDTDGDGVWTLKLDVQPGRYSYRILVDEDRWLTDPAADAQVDDGFGGIDSVRHVL